ncbi:MAG: arsenosugar biosynthesis radical SAM protein ArsS [Nitrospirae bacterium]|nr:arsenosugar biosynthesis radical SAM protein ArsS [Nitrospirota bacterium]
MNDFEQKLKEAGYHPLTARDISTLQVNIGYKCNLRCRHCHVEASPERKEVMSLSTMAKLLYILGENKEINAVDITGGSPELNPYFKYFVKSCADTGKNVIVRSNLAIYSEKGLEDIPDFLAEQKVKIVASLPCYTEQGVDSQRGTGTYKKAISALKRLNSIGYGNGAGLEVDIMFNPAKAEIAPDQHVLENVYRGKLKEMHNVTFNHLIALSNMPIGRLGKSLSDEGKKKYIKELEEKFNPDTVKNLMCRHLVSISPDGKIYDCDFWQMINLPVKSDCSHVDRFDYAALSSRSIVTTPLCFMCAAGSGASCSGALA